MGTAKRIPFLAVPGTWAWNGSSAGQWYDPHSLWSVAMRQRGFEHQHLLIGDPRPFVWSTDINGQQFWRRWFGFAPKVNDWQAAGHNLYAYCVPAVAPDRRVPSSHLHVIAHSHGLQVVLFACADGLKINTLVSVGSPVRADLLDVARRARPNIRFWWHFHSDATDRWQWLGETGDGKWQWPWAVDRTHPFADQNVGLPGVGHSNILHDTRIFNEVWAGPLDLIRRHHGKPDVNAS